MTASQPQPNQNLDDMEVIDLEEYSKEDRPIPKGKKYRVRIDRELYIFDQEMVTGRELLEKAGKTPYDHFMISQKLKKGQVRRIGYDEKVDLTTPGVERFITLPLDQTEGDGSKDFSMPEQDQSFLDSVFTKWEAVEEGATRWLLLHGFPVPEGYTSTEATLALMIPPTYPDTQIDMAYFSPHLKLIAERPINALAEQEIKGQKYQRWSRHRKSADEWRVGVDDVSTHVELVRFWLEKEVAAK